MLHRTALSMSLLSALLLSLGWPPMQMPFLLFFGLIPLLYLELKTRHKRAGLFFPYLYLALFLWNLATTWWVWYASPGGAIAMLLANSLLMCVPFLLYRSAVPVLGNRRALLAFVLYWLAFETLHHNWELAYPWLTLGNGFAAAPGLVQFYEYTGVGGGTLWILAVNVFIFRWLTDKTTRYLWLPAATLILPLLISLYLGLRVRIKPGAKAEVVVVQPNIDPYEKFNPGAELEQVDSFIQLARTQLSPETKLLVLPETAIVEYLNEDALEQSASIQRLKALLRDFPALRIVTGASTYRFFPDESLKSATARQSSEGLWYDSYNTALLITAAGVEEIYHKSRLVPGVERMPYPGIFGFLEHFAIDMGGITGSLGMDTSAIAFNLSTGPGLAPLICYESIFGDYAREFVRKGAELVLVITNDGWWRDTPGYKQHMQYARLRAIENRKEVIRSANTGISCHINTVGEITQKTNWWEPAVLKLNAVPSGELTFYTRNGDGIGKVGSFLAVFMMLGIWVRRLLLKREMA